MKYFFNIFLCLSVLILISGCSRYVNYAEKTFRQASTFEVDLKKARAFIRSNKSYDQFTTVGLFDVLWFNKDVQEVYKKVRLERSGVLDNQELSKLETKFENDNKFITFYLLLPPKDAQDVAYTHFDGITYTQNNIDWKVFIEIDGVKYAPVEFAMQNDIDSDFSVIFGKSANRYRSVYIARFEKEINNKKIILDTSKELKLFLKTTKYIIPFCWRLN